MADETKANETRAARDEAGRRKALTAAGIGLGVGIGSAAIAAALIYARGTRKRDDAQPPRTSKAPETPVQEGSRWTD